MVIPNAEHTVTSRFKMSSVLTSDAISATGSSAVSVPPRRLLIVDDDPSVRHALWITFRGFYQVDLADSGQKGIDSFREHPADVTVLDVRMPGMDGLEALKRIKELDPNAEVILLTAYESVDYIREALRLGACDYITKPFQVEGLRTAVQNAMERREASRKAAVYDERLAQLQREIQHQQIREELARTRNEIYASIIHDLNGPLTVIAGYVELMQAGIQHAHVLESDQLTTLRSQAHSISRQVTNCIELSRRYLGFLEGKVNSNAFVGIKEVLYDVAELLKAHPHARANRLVIEPFDSDAEAAMNGTDLLQILLNLTINALQSSQQSHRVELHARLLPAGAPRTFLQTAPGARLLRSPEFEESSALAAISVQDDGPGMPEHLLERIFDAYFTTKAPGQGTGLGLSIVRRLVFQSRGAIHVYSHPGEGTVFTVYVPLRGAS
jgi:signal transduction histidine kinase